MPVKNAEPYLEECLDTILNQTYINFELISVNDNSTDRSLDILRYYALQDERIHVLDSEGNGIIEALRLAFSESKGIYLTRMDADDKMHSNKLERMHAVLQDKGRGQLAVGCVEYFAESGIGDGYKRYAEWLNNLTRNASNFSDIYRECVIPSPCWMVHRDDLIACDAFNPNRYPEDYDLCFRFYEENLTVHGVTTILHYWRDYPERSSRNDPNYLDNRFFDIKLHYFLRLECQDTNELVILGAGKKAKYIAKALREKDLRFDWYTNNKKKLGQEIYGILIQNQEDIFAETVPKTMLPNTKKIIVAISNPSEQTNIESKLQALDLELGKDYFFFC